MIPSLKMPKIYEPAHFNSEKMVELCESDRVLIELRYPKMKLKNAVKRCYVRSGVAKRLIKASQLLPNGIKMKIYDTWRPLSLQRELYEFYKEKIINDFGLAYVTEKEREAQIQKYVSMPAGDRDLPPVHTTGGAVDLTLIDENGKELPMGTDFDSFSDMTRSDYFERNCNTEYDREIRDNRRLLYKVMTESGFTNLPSEWWHFDYGDRFWAYYNKKPALYEGIFKEEEINEKLLPNKEKG